MRYEVDPRGGWTTFRRISCDLKVWSVPESPVDSANLIHTAVGNKFACRVRKVNPRVGELLSDTRQDSLGVEGVPDASSRTNEGGTNVSRDSSRIVAFGRDR